MNHPDHPSQAERPPAGSLSRGRIAFAFFLAVALFLLLAEHRAHLFGWLPFLVILACPLMHLFHHGGHGGHGSHGDSGRTVDAPSGPPRRSAGEDAS